MSNRYWVGGSGSWSDDTNHWATTSGGSPSVGNLPTSSDNVFIDSNSGLSGGTITIDIIGICKDLTSTTSASYEIAEGDANTIAIYGSIALESGLTISLPNIIFSSSTTETLTFNSATISSKLAFGFDESEAPTNGTYTLQDNLLITGGFQQVNGTFDANDHNVTAAYFNFISFTGYTPTVIMGSGTWEGYAWRAQENNEEVVTITPETSTIKILELEEGGVAGGGKTYNNIWFVKGVSGVYIADSNTFNNFKIDAGVVLTFIESTTQTVSSFTAVGETENLIILNAFDQNEDETIDQFTLSCPSGTIDCDYLDISNSVATGGATWNAGSHSLDTANNDGWIFAEPPEPSSSKQIKNYISNSISI